MSGKIILESEEEANLLYAYYKMGRKKREERMLRELRMKKVLTDFIPSPPNQDPGGVQDDIIDEIIDNSHHTRK